MNPGWQNRRWTGAQYVLWFSEDETVRIENDDGRLRELSDLEISYLLERMLTLVKTREMDDLNNDQENHQSSFNRGGTQRGGTPDFYSDSEFDEARPDGRSRLELGSRIFEKESCPPMDARS